MLASSLIPLTAVLAATLTLETDSISVARKETRKMSQCETDGATHSVLATKAANLIMMDGVRLSLGRASALKVLSASTVVWGLRDTEMIRDSKIRKIGR